MYKVIIVDDEDLIREGLMAFFDWDSVGFSVSGEAVDGDKAYELILEQRPHVVLTDIKMPFCTGIELMERMRQNHIDAKIIVLSGYDEFEYASAAIDAGAAGYLLKPIKFDKLREIFLKIKKEIDFTIMEEINRNRAYKLLREEFIHKLVNGTADSREEIYAKAANLGVDLAYSQFTILILEHDDYSALLEKYTKEDMELLNFALINIAKELCGNLGAVYCYQPSEKSVGILICGHDYLINDVRLAANELRQTIEDLLKLKVTISAGDILDNVLLIHEAHKAAEKLLEMKFFLGKSRLITSGDALPSFSSPGGSYTLNTDRLISLIQGMDGEVMDRFIDSSFDSLRTRDAVFDLFYQFMKFAVKFSDKNPLNFPISTYLSHFEYQKVLQVETLNEVISDVKLVFAKIIGSMEEGGNKNRHRLMDDVKKYVEAHYAENISLESSAEQIHMHPMYVSKIFKRETGRNFIDYLTETRITKAKELLGDLNHKIYEISEKVGYNDSKHFSKVFKNIVGITPRDYRKIVLGYMDDM